MSTERPTQSDKELWRSLAADRAVASGPVSDLDFAAWLEGRLSETAAARIEAAVAADPEMRRAALELSEVLGMPLPAAPARLEVRAKALVGFEVEQRGGARRAVRLAVRQGPALCLAAPGDDDGRGDHRHLRLHAGRRPRRIDGPGALCHMPADRHANELTEFLVSDGI